ncbi:hypothetical protein A5821_002041 [Enterococcus sp. 7F3_DIV0205]|uniref:Endonuclease GajA/Old nuclease/RecF-like AAA domain-containing protein n=1 Tax=Candidatus Enterococcus palustris TaxID=1834189 RepID=A0AAQ3W8Y4_9ENTE|nr:ATP-binding protein [Enterococcus sp. 7F3_DIV0205]OTN82480.1 hypothetical protein A5821_002391 [Enterococcus sp. 7F3_DIV0205]
MKLVKMKLVNFRGYGEEIFYFKQMTGLIGKNDVGKSTILEALDIFFNAENKNGVIQPDINDLLISCDEDKYYTITCFFEVPENEVVIIDDSNPTNLKEEYLLNKDGLLEIEKRWDCTGKSITNSSLSINIIADIPYIGEKQFLTMKIVELRKELENIKDEIDDYNDVNKSLKAEIRKRLYKFYTNDIEKREHPINIKNIETDTKTLWKSLSKNFPMYFLFQSDRNNSDGDNEIQTPLKAAARKAVSEKLEELEEIENYIINEVSKVGEDTLKKLSEFDNSIAKGLGTNYKTKAWDSLFSFNISDDKEIPINKRGSGVRRLILLSYFRAEAEKSFLRADSKGIIYAIEEPETSQHPDFQLMILQSLEKICENDNTQVIFTTHTPEIAKLFEPESLIFISKNSSEKPRVETNELDKINGIISSLGILPSVSSKFVICVEGENDLEFLKRTNQAVPELKEIIDLSEISIIPMAGSKLKQWIDRNYLEDSNVREFHIYDSDVNEYCEKIIEINRLNDGRRFGINTQLLEMENYIPPELISKEFGIDIPDVEVWKKTDVPKFLLDKTFLQIPDKKKREMALKGILNKKLPCNFTKEILENYGVYEELESWFIKFAECSR